MNIKPVDSANLVFRGSAPETQSDVDFLSKMVECVLDLQSSLDEDIRGLANHEVEMFGMLDKPISHFRILMSDFFPPTIDEIQTAINITSKNVRREIRTYIHCSHGVDRTGMVIACLRMKNGWSFQAALDEMYQNGFHKFPYFWWIYRLKQYAKLINL